MGYDGWASGEHGSFWGAFGAAGVLVQNPHGEVLLQLRASWCHHPGTWGLPGGARARGESALDAALREAAEEHDVPAHDLRITGSHTLDFGYWSYVTFVARCTGDWQPRLVSAEADDARWVRRRAVPHLPLHPGVAGTWRHLEALLDRP